MFMRALNLSLMALGAALAVASANAHVPAREAIVGDAAIPWHPSLAVAKQAAVVSRRPVLVVFSAGATESGAALDRDVFPAAETVALLTACFEPVRIDIDVDATTARAMGVARIPMACIVDPYDRILSRFECPLTPAAFVAAASRAAQEAAGGAARTVTPVAAIRERSDFAIQAVPAVPAVPAVAPPPLDPAFHAVDEPSLPPAPPSWPADQASRPMSFTPDSQASRPPTPIEPAAPGAAASAWLSPPAVVATAAPPAPITAPSAAPAPAPMPAAPTPTPEPAKKSAGASVLAALQKPFTIFSKPKQPDAATPAPAIPVPPAPAVAAAGMVPAGPDPSGSMPLGMEGFCPVTLMDKGTWVEGRAQWGARHRGRTYLFAGAEQQRAFLADPDRYAPALSGDDPVVACDSGRQVAGQRRYGVTYQMRTYLFSSPETRAAFAANPQHYTTRVTIAERPTAPGTILR